MSLSERYITKIEGRIKAVTTWYTKAGDQIENVVLVRDEFDEYKGNFSSSKKDKLGLEITARGKLIVKTDKATQKKLEKEVAKYTAKYAIGEIPRPAHWSGIRILPTYIEFWRDGAFRLHDRIIFQRDKIDQTWTKSRFYP